PRGTAHDIGACMEFSTELFTRGTVGRMIATYLSVLESMVRSPAPTVDDLLGAAVADRAPDADKPGPAVPPQVSDTAAAGSGIPTDRPRRPGGYRLEQVSGSVTGTPDAATVLAAWTGLLAWYSGGDRVPLGLARPG